MKSLTLSLIVILLLPQAVTLQAKGRHIPTNLFGIALRPAAASLLTEIESRFHKSLREGTYIDLEPTNWADSKVDDDGAPLIRMNTTTSPSEAIIVHELFHLKLKTEGYAESFIFNMPQAINTDSNAAALEFLLRHLYATIEHWMFYTEMRRMKIYPNVELSAELEQARKNPGFFKAERPSRQNGALYYLKAALQFNDSKRIGRLVKWYRSNNWTESLELGHRLTQQVIKNNPKTADGAATTFVNCLNLIYKGMLNFSLEGWQTHRKGEVELKIAVIQIMPAKA